LSGAADSGLSQIESNYSSFDRGESGQHFSTLFRLTGWIPAELFDSKVAEVESENLEMNQGTNFERGW
jgi:hypothetical protein